MTKCDIYDRPGEFLFEYSLLLDDENAPILVRYHEYTIRDSVWTGCQDYFAEGVSPDLLYQLLEAVVGHPHLYWYASTKSLSRVMEAVEAAFRTTPIMRNSWGRWLHNQPIPNLVLGMTVHDQQSAQDRIGGLYDLNLRHQFVFVDHPSGPIDLTKLALDEVYTADALTGTIWEGRHNNDQCESGMDMVLLRPGKNYDESIGWGLQRQARLSKVPFFTAERL